MSYATIVRLVEDGTAIEVRFDLTGAITGLKLVGADLPLSGQWFDCGPVRPVELPQY